MSFASCWGPVERYLGLLATTLEAHDAAERHFDAALLAARAIPSPPLVAVIRCDLAAMLLRRGGEGDAGRARVLAAEAAREAAACGLDGLQRRAAAIAG
jgi:hypothetical protein